MQPVLVSWLALLGSGVAAQQLLHLHPETKQSQQFPVCNQARVRYIENNVLDLPHPGQCGVLSSRRSRPRSPFERGDNREQSAMSVYSFGHHFYDGGKEMLT